MKKSTMLAIAAISGILMGAEPKGCFGPAIPQLPAQDNSKRTQCKNISAYYCQSPNIKDGEACCFLASGVYTKGQPYAFMCAYGADKDGIGCDGTLEGASGPSGCQNNPVGIVQCVLP
jgi:hypothetical protein